MKWTIALLVVVAGLVLGISALFFDGATVLVIGAALLIVGFFSGSAVTLGVITRRNAERRTPAPPGPHGPPAHDHAEVIPDRPLE